MTSIIAEIINVITEAVIIFIYLSRIMPIKKYNGTAIIAASVAATVIMSIVTIKVQNSNIQLCMLAVLIFIWALILFDGTIMKKLFSTFIFVIIMVVSDAVFIAVLYLVNYGEPVELLTMGKGRIIGMIGSKIFAFWTVIIFSRIYSKKMRELPFKYWLIMLCMPFISAILLYGVFSASFDSSKTAIVYFLAVVCILIFNLFIFNFFDTFSAQIKLNILEKKLQLDNENYRYINEIYTEIRQLKHDMKNQIMTTVKMFNQGDQEQALEYLKKYSNEIVSVGDICYTGISTLDAVINLKGKTARDKSICFQTKIDVTAKIELDEVELCRIFDNALDNAIEACDRFQSGKKFILMSLNCKNDRLFKISISNSSNKINVKQLTTEKNDDKLHGLGVSIIQKSVEKLGGMMSVDYENDIFTLNILLKY